VALTAVAYNLQGPPTTRGSVFVASRLSASTDGGFSIRRL
jgi:hypothetical protein